MPRPKYSTRNNSTQRIAVHNVYGESVKNIFLRVRLIRHLVSIFDMVVMGHRNASTITDFDPAYQK